MGRIARKFYNGKDRLLYIHTPWPYYYQSYLPRSAFSLRTSLKLSPLLRVDCRYFNRASFCPFLPKASVFTGPAWRPHLHLEKSECTHFTKSSSFTITFSETAITSSYKWSLRKNKKACLVSLSSTKPSQPIHPK